MVFLKYVAKSQPKSKMTTRPRYAAGDERRLGGGRRRGVDPCGGDGPCGAEPRGRGGIVCLAGVGRGHAFSRGAARRGGTPVVSADSSEAHDGTAGGSTGASHGMRVGRRGLVDCMRALSLVVF